jgi:vanillate/4-hydroxybenzoate decarboxylase subunit D
LNCPRCDHETIEKLYSSPVPGVWDVLQCQQCLYTWRTSEPARRTQRDAYPASFKMTAADIANAPEVPTIPPLLTEPQR